MIVRAAHPADAHGIARVHVDSWRTTYAGIVPEDALNRLNYDIREQFWQGILTDQRKAQVVFVAEDDAQQIVGFVSGGPEREGIEGYDGEIYAIYLLAEVQRQGIGRQLLGSVTQALAAKGHNALLAWVLADNPACDFYKALGGVYVAEKDIQINGTTLREIAYGWPDIRALLEVKENTYGNNTPT